ncbi:MAG TPA: type II toxin-antitoxin system prevent-host-death family antitoxin [Kaistia sp.]|nr:type II toxin-antitoxin system prevent-host-death family antitoxin [Kaistia sp.]
MVKLVKGAAVKQVSIYEAKTHLSSLIDQAARGDEVVITRNGVPVAKLVGTARSGEPRRPAHAMGVTFIAPDFDEPDEDIDALFESRE